MSSEIDPFMAQPINHLFVEAAFQAHENTGRWLIPDSRRFELMGQFGLSAAQAAATCYLAESRAAEYSSQINGIRAFVGDLHE